MASPILHIENVTYPAEPPFDVGVAKCSLVLNEGGLVAVRTEKSVAHMPLGGLALGILVPREGRVRFMGRDWQEASPDEVSTMRARIGRVFPDDGWVSNLDVDENIVLAPLHHTQRLRDELMTEASEWARRFGLSEIPHVRIHLVKRSDLRVLEWVRAFMGEKRMLVLEYPMNNVDPSSLDDLLRETRRARGRGVGVLWIARGDTEWQALSAEADAAFECKDQQWIQTGGR